MDMSLFTSFEGRINRQKWWLGLIVLLIGQWILYFILMMFLGPSMMETMETGDPAATIEAMSSGMMTAILVTALVFLWPGLALYAKRWHDRGKSGWWTLIILVPIIGSIWALVECGFLRGNEGPNAYGPDPLAASAS